MRTVFGVFLAIVTMGCSGPTLEACKSACANVHGVVAASVGGESQAQGADLEACVRTCATQDAPYIDCLRGATTTKELRECHGESDG